MVTIKLFIFFTHSFNSLGSSEDSDEHYPNIGKEKSLLYLSNAFFFYLLCNRPSPGGGWRLEERGTPTYFFVGRLLLFLRFSFQKYFFLNGPWKFPDCVSLFSNRASEMFENTPSELLFLLSPFSFATEESSIPHWVEWSLFFAVFVYNKATREDFHHENLSSMHCVTSSLFQHSRLKLQSKPSWSYNSTFWADMSRKSLHLTEVSAC